LRCRSTTGGGSAHGSAVTGRTTLGRLRLGVLDPEVAGTAARSPHDPSRAFDDDGNLQPAPDDPFLASKVTYWESNGQITRTVKIT
jgi:hypothetical protein